MVNKRYFCIDGDMKYCIVYDCNIFLYKVLVSL